MNGRMKLDHGMGHGLTGGIGVKAAVDFQVLFKEWSQPSGIWPGAGGGEAAMLGMKCAATEGVDG